MGGFSQQLFTKDDLSGTAKDFVSEVDNMHVINGGTNARERGLSGGKSELALASYFGRINYVLRWSLIYSHSTYVPMVHLVLERQALGGISFILWSMENL